ncbi:MAG: hypothetical protein A2283_15845 [Lentisphaerae bacterium RIFOXYA12_FULL_48_11]|nr:MAG: hypothetical protein A2283_15845 [Lentisphaerae bacterium RIFOXYA12_FULL_48_11]
MKTERNATALEASVYIQRRKIFRILAYGNPLLVLTANLIAERFLSSEHMMIFGLVSVIGGGIVLMITFGLFWRCPSCGEMFTRGHNYGQCENCNVKFITNTLSSSEQRKEEAQQNSGGYFSNRGGLKKPSE